MADSSTRPAIFIVSGGVGASGEQLVYTVLAQFPGQKIQVSTIGHVRQPEQIVSLVEQAQACQGCIVATLVDAGLRSLLVAEAHQKNVPVVDLMGPLIGWLTSATGQPPLQEPGKYRQLHREYYDRVAAIDYSIAHDDGKNPEGWPQAEIMLVGVSRSGKTPLSLYLAVLGWKVANIPLVPQIPVPEALFELNPEIVVGLDINPEQLLVFRRQRQMRLGVSGDSPYTDLDTIREEIRLARKVFLRGGFAVIDMTDKTIEQSADEIIRKLSKH